MNNLLEMFSYSFMIRALVVGILISICAALVGVPLVLRKKSMIGDGLSHVSFGAFAIASVLNFVPTVFALPIVVLVAFIILHLGEKRKIHGDSAIALISVSSLAIGTFVVSLAGTNIDINNYLFGSILSINTSDVIVSIILSAVILFIFCFFYHKIFAITFDETFAKAIGVNTKLYDAFFSIACSIIIVLGMRLMGALLISSLIIFPVLSAKQITKTYKETIIVSALVALISFVSGLVLSYLLGTPTGATVVITNLLILIFLSIIGKINQNT